LTAFIEFICEDLKWQLNYQDNYIFPKIQIQTLAEIIIFAINSLQFFKMLISIIIYYTEKTILLKNLKF